MSQIVTHFRHGSIRRFAIAVVVWLLPVGALAADPAPTNLELMTDLTSEVVGELVDQFSERLAGRAVVLKKYAASEQYQFITTVITRLFARRGITTYPNQAPTDGTPVVTFEYQTLSYDLAYTKVYRSYLIGGKKVGRKADVTILATLYESGGAVAWTGEAERDYEDTFGYGEVRHHPR